MYNNWFNWIIFFIILYLIQKNWGNENSPDSLNVMLNYRYHGENRLIAQKFPSIGGSGGYCSGNR